MATFKRIDHVVIGTQDVKDAVRLWERNLGLKADESLAQPQADELKIARLPVGDAFLELVQPARESGRFAEQLKERGEGMFSISVEVDDLEGAVKHLRDWGARVSDPEVGIWPGSRIARVSQDSTHGVSIQLIQRS